ncbi:protein TIFY 10B [Malania oleifera]|uniref:protein TIFY 10B n=1 Tax=Malania oleifera TaxID=397392 RepID=UPI0025ADD064|nr:protein TIFY 10B [Malania oleifera]
MSGLPPIPEASRKLGKAAPEKSNFAQTCNLLSQYLKEKRTLPDLGRGILEPPKGRSETFQSQTVTTMDLLPTMEKPAGETPGLNGGAVLSSSSSSQHLKSMDLFPQFSGFRSSDRGEDTTIRSTDFGKPARQMTASPAAAAEPESATLTIFYSGTVMVYGDITAEKAREIMDLASKGSPSASAATVAAAILNSAAAARGGGGGASTSSSAPSSSTSMGPSSSGAIFSHNIPSQEPDLPREPQAIASDMPIARRNSLHRFLEKRKDRSAARAPYQPNKPLVAGPADEPKPRGEGNSSAEMEMDPQTSEHLELKL